MSQRATERQLHRQMLRIRLLQQRIESLYHLDEMRTPVHLCIGQEAVAVGVCAALERTDRIQSNHRGHGHYLAKGGELYALVAELYGRESGCSKGRGGSMHLVAPEVGHLGSSAIVGGGIPIGVGQALAARMLGERRVVAVFFGDGAADEGVLYESVRYASLRRLPVIFVLEDNEYSVCSHTRRRHPWAPLFLRADPELLHGAELDGNDVLAVRAATIEAVERARAGQGPSFLWCRTYRIRGHAGSYSDAHIGYRGQDEIDAWSQRCPIARSRERLLAAGVEPSWFEGLEAQLQAELDEVFARAQEAAFPDPASLGRHVFAEGNHGHR